MGTSRRDFVKTTAAASAALALGARDARGERIIEKAPAPLKILILGGTGFTGPHQVNYAVSRGHTVTVFNRGQRQADIPKSVEQLRGDRNLPNGEGVASLKGNRTWDVVIDVPTTNPRWVRDAGQALQGRAKQYIFISTISVYADTSKAWMDEDTPRLKYEGAKDPFTLTPQELGPLYGQMKTLSEMEVEKWFPGKATIVRPGLIVGPGDPSDRFTYWPMRIARGGEVLAPGDGKDAVQIIDARDLAEWVIRLAENNTTGIYNATGPRAELSMGDMLGGIRGALPGDLNVKFTWVPWDFLREQQVRGWSSMPVVVMPTADNAGFSRVSIERAVAKGLTFRPLADTARATLEWHNKRPEVERTFPREITRPDGTKAMTQFGITAQKEAEVLAAWKAKPRA